MEENQLLFEIEGIPRRKNILKKLRSYIAVYSNGMYIELDGEKDHIDLSEIYDIYIQEPIIEQVTSRTTFVEFYEEGEQNWYELEDGTFPDLAAKMEQVLNSKWMLFAEKRKYPDTVKWFIACCTIVYISSGQNPAIYGSAYKEPETIAEHRKVLYEGWGFNKKEDLLEMLPKLYEGRAIQSYSDDWVRFNELDENQQELLQRIKQTCGDKSIWAWDLQRLILLCGFGYLCDYISYEDSLDWALKAGQKLQSIYHSWDDFMNSYLLGFCYWSGEDLQDKSTEAYERQQIYAYYKNKSNSPWAISWNYTLSREW